jgi:hypothetical protein
MAKACAAVSRCPPGGKDGFNKPRFHVTRNADGAAASISVGDTIGIVSQLFSPWGHLPPAFDARRLVSAEPIELWTRKLAAEPVHFVSYRIRDGSREAFRKVQDRIGQGKVFFG